VSSRDSIAAGKRPNQPATAASSWPGKIQCTSRLRTPSATGLSGGAAAIVTCSGPLAGGQLRVLPPHECTSVRPAGCCPGPMAGLGRPWPGKRGSGIPSVLRPAGRRPFKTPITTSRTDANRTSPKPWPSALLQRLLPQNVRRCWPDGAAVRCIPSRVTLLPPHAPGEASSGRSGCEAVLHSIVDRAGTASITQIR
jgi:hypothetical protein